MHTKKICWAPSCYYSWTVSGHPAEWISICTYKYFDTGIYYLYFFLLGITWHLIHTQCTSLSFFHVLFFGIFGKKGTHVNMTIWFLVLRELFGKLRHLFNLFLKANFFSRSIGKVSCMLLVELDFFSGCLSLLIISQCYGRSHLRIGSNST